MIIERPDGFYVLIKHGKSIHEEDNWLASHGINFLKEYFWLEEFKSNAFRLPNESVALQFWTLFGEDKL